MGFRRWVFGFRVLGLRAKGQGRVKELASPKTYPENPNSPLIKE